MLGTFRGAIHASPVQLVRIGLRVGPGISTAFTQQHKSKPSARPIKKTAKAEGIGKAEEIAKAKETAKV